MNPVVTPERIDSAYQQLGYKAGWRFMTSPVSSFLNPRILLVSLNPSGRVEHGPRWSQEEGCSYLVESWDGQSAGQDTLQIQIQRLINHLGASFEDVASAHFVPFRSQRWADLENRDQAIKFARSLWTDFVTEIQPDYVVCLGTEVGKFIPSLFGSHSLVKRPTGWGNISLSVGKTSYGGQIMILPHLGTFKLFSREECKPYLSAAIGVGSLEDA